MVGILCRLAFPQTEQEPAEAFLREQLLGQPFGNRPVELLHRHRAALSGSLAFLGAGGTGVVAVAA